MIASASSLRDAFAAERLMPTTRPRATHSIRVKVVNFAGSPPR